MNVFEAVRDKVSARDAAERYGIRVDKHGMAICPFHPDKNPSMKVDRRFHCFACGADGDAIDLAAGLFGLSLVDASKKIADDFGIPIRRWGSLSKAQRKRIREKQAEVQQIRKVDETYQRMEHEFFIGLTDYYHRLRGWMEQYFPKSLDAEPDPRFTEAAQSITQVEYVLDCFLDGKMPERIEIMNDLWKKVKKVAGDSQRSFRASDEGTDETDPEERSGFTGR